MDVLVVGSFNVDHAWRVDRLPAPGATLAGSYACGPGGKGFNQAVAARRAGAATAFACCLGDDDGGRLAQRLCAQDGIALAAARVDAPTGSAGIFVAADGANSIVVAAGANAGLTPAQAAAAVAAHPAAVVLAQLESPPPAVHAALAAARARGALALLNPAPANAPTDADLLALADVLTPNETEFAALLARHAGIALAADAVAGLADAALHAHCRRLHPGGSVVVTLGAQGVFVSHAPERPRGDAALAYRVPAPPTDVVDTTGAGDALNGALAAGLARRPQAAFADLVRFAVRYASRSTERAGAALAMPHLALD